MHVASVSMKQQIFGRQTSIHVDSFRYSCKQWHYQETFRGSPKRREASMLEVIIYPVASKSLSTNNPVFTVIISYQGSIISRLIFDFDIMMSVIVVYQCDCKATQHGNLKIHQKSKHGIIRHSCAQCGHKATAYLKLHVHKRFTNCDFLKKT
jgi:hypothetical protein